MQKKIVDLSQQQHKQIHDDQLHPVLRRVFAHRGLVKPGDYSYDPAELLDPNGLRGISKASEMLLGFRSSGKKITIVGDYDCDGATATAVAVKGLKLLGFRNVSYHIPNRFCDGYGLSNETVNKCIAKHNPDLIMTVDNGISSLQGVQHAKSMGLNVIITDHHLPGDELPKADAIVNPQLCADSFSSQNLAGVGVMFYLLIKLRQDLLTRKIISKGTTSPNLAQLLDIVALGTVADLVELDKNNRILVHHGLHRIRSGRCCHAIRALIEQSQCNMATVSTTDISFRVAPKLNAAGRMADMHIGVAALLAEDSTEAAKKVAELVAFNKQRMDVQSDMVHSALRQVKKDSHVKSGHGVCVYENTWHQGVIGILASRIKDHVYQPTVVLADDEEENYVKGSARSIVGINIREVFASISHKNPDVLTKFGGHAMAAGLTIEKKHVETFKQLFHAEIESQDREYFVASITTDGPLLEHEINIHTADAIQGYGLWGQGFTEPIFCNEARVVRAAMLKGQHLKLRLAIGGQRREVDAIWFYCPDNAYHRCKSSPVVQVYYQINKNEWQGVVRLGLHISHIEAAKVTA